MKEFFRCNTCSKSKEKKDIAKVLYTNTLYGVSLLVKCKECEK